MSLVALSKATGVISARALSDRFSIPFEILSKILQRIGQYGLVESVQGPKGGYRLARELKDITLDQVVEAMQGPVRLVPCGTEDGCERTELCLIRPGVVRIQDLLIEFLKKHTLQDMILERRQE
jgi:Rrf2 family protein